MITLWILIQLDAPWYIFILWGIVYALKFLNAITSLKIK